MKHCCKFILPLAFLGLLLFSSCNKNTDNPPVPMGQVWFHLHTNIDTNEVDTGTVVRDANGRQFKLKVAQFYASGFNLHKRDGSVYTIQNAYIEKVIANEAYYVGMAPAGNYTSVSFNIGLDPGINFTDPSGFPYGSIFAPQTPSMWFGSTAQGYIFMNVQGKTDTSALNNGPVNVPFSFQLGTNALLRTVNLPERVFSVVPASQSFVHIICDYGKLMQGLNFKTQNAATPFTNLPLATQIANNIPNMCHYEY
jgi:hypothetical protein